jgi:hypothetical protein
VVSQTGGADSGAVGPQTAPLPPDLAEIMAAWPALPEALRSGILAMIRGAVAKR